MEKYRMLRESIAHWPGIQLMDPPAATDVQLSLAHAPSYVQALVHNQLSPLEMRTIGFPWTPEMVERSRRSTGATIAAAEAALEGRRSGGAPIAINLAGGTHHAGPARGEGFCCFNDAAVAARVLQQSHGLRRIAVLDLDVHQGNGTAEIFQSDDSVVTVSVHGERNYPFRKPRSDLDIGLQDGAGDADYLEAVGSALQFLQAQTEIDLLIYLAGADPLEQDRLGRLSVSLAGLAERDRRVFCWAQSQQLPLAVAMAGGYSRPIDLTVAVHRQTVQLALEIFSRNTA
jgi:acetoin utilization deacetylase AcuC-like enzyme